jgi:hypothetical protein
MAPLQEIFKFMNDHPFVRYIPDKFKPFKHPDLGDRKFEITMDHDTLFPLVRIYYDEPYTTSYSDYYIYDDGDCLTTCNFYEVKRYITNPVE